MANNKSNTSFLRISGSLMPDNRMLLHPPYLTQNGRGSINEKNSPVQIELYQQDKLLIKWGAKVAAFQDSKKRPLMYVEKRERFDLFGKPMLVRAKVPFPSETTRIVFHHDDIKVHQLDVPENGPVFKGSVEVKKHTKATYKIKWRVIHPDKLPVFFMYVPVLIVEKPGIDWHLVSANKRQLYLKHQW